MPRYAVGESLLPYCYFALESIDDDRRDASAFAEYGDWLNDAIETMRGLVHAFYNRDFSFGRLVRDRPDLRGDITDCLIGNFGRRYDELFEVIGQRTILPAPLGVGEPAP